MTKSKFLFGDIIVINKFQIGVILKTWYDEEKDIIYYDIYNRMTSNIEQYLEQEIERYRVRHKYLNTEALEYQNI